jgi:HD-GYP domain-containing protein (c-di-GMP phosphodiesterase class II)
MVAGLHIPSVAKTLGLSPRRGEVFQALARVLDYRPAPEVPHHARVAALATRVAAGLGNVDPRTTLYAALVHDIGMPPDEKPWSCVSPEDQANDAAVRAHPLVGAQTLAAVPGLVEVAQIVLDHHEWANGHGYPRGKSGDEIPPAAQALRFADTCDLVLREQTSPELVAFVHALVGRAGPQVGRAVMDAGLAVLGEEHLYTLLLSPEDVGVLLASSLERHAARDVVVTEPELTGLLGLFGRVADERPSDKVGHSRRVANLTVLIAMAMGLGEEETALAKWAALVHDVGVVAVPKALLDRPGLLAAEELADVRQRIARVQDFLGPVRGLEEVVRVASAHEERYDGSGTPDGLAASAIPVGARILSVCHAFDALTSHRPYREARDVGLAVDILVRGSGSLFDPEVVSAAVPVFLIAQPREEPVEIAP